jgi:hypothetical protein
MALESTQPLEETSTMNISLGVKAAAAYGWRPYLLHVPVVLKSGYLNLLDISWYVVGLYRDYLTIIFTFTFTFT